MMNWTNELKDNPIPWLLESNPWTKYRTLTDLLDLSETDGEVINAKSDLLSDENIIGLANEIKDWIAVAPTRNNDPKISYFKLRILADFGIKHTNLNLSDTINKATQHIIDNLFAVRGQIPERPKKGEKFKKPDLTADVWHVSPCNSPIITYALYELGVRNVQVEKAIEELKSKWIDKRGWFCHFFFVESQFKKLQIGCPIAGLMALDIFSKVPELKESEYSKFAFEPLKFHKDYGKTLYYFGRSKKFWTFKYPFVWYNALYLADVLTMFNFLKDEPVVRELIDWITNSQSLDSRFKPTSVFMNYKGWDFSNKKEPSPWITYLCCRILKQYSVLPDKRSPSHEISDQNAMRNLQPGSPEIIDSTI
ncbi:MAG: hypothetical protein KAR19_15195 [Bacteroidales bacterium]|nr:hypothetical protein [Bacteroidales bacterium]